jgi:hypothetical protein
MARNAETIPARNHTVVGLAGVALHTVLQADLFIAYTFANRLFTLMLEQVHMILAHPLRILNALPAHTDIRLGHIRLGSPNSGNAQAKQKRYEQPHHSPRPI